MKGNRVRFNVGGKKFETTAITLSTAGSDSFFGPLLGDNWNTNTDDDEEVFIDRDPDCFAVILNLLRTGELSIPPHVGKDALIREAQFYGVLELVRCASWVSPLNGDFLVHSSSITCRARQSEAKMIFGSPNGGFCVGNNTSLYVYDWMLQEHPTIHLGCGKLNEVLWVGTNNIAIATTNTVRMFDAGTGALKFDFIDKKGNQVSGATSMCLSDSNIFHLSQNDNRAIGILDLESGKSIRSINLRLPSYYSSESDSSIDSEELSQHSYLHTINGSISSLLVMHVSIPSGYGFSREHFEAQIIDARERGAYKRSWSSSNYKPNRRHNSERKIRGAVVMEDRNSVCVMSSGGEFGFLDLRFTGDIEWSNVSSGLHSARRIKLVYQGDRIYMLSWNYIEVFSVTDLVNTEAIPVDVVDFSISDDRLFMLGNRTNVVQVWETPRSCLSFL